MASQNAVGSGSLQPYKGYDSGRMAAGDPEESPEENIYLMTPHVTVSFDDVFLEPEGANSFEVIHKLNALVFKFTQLGLYRVFSIIFGIPIAFLMGILFALHNFTTVFLIQPLVKMMFITLRPQAMMTKAVFRSFLDPCWQSVGLIFSRFAGRFVFNLRGTNMASLQAPTGQTTIHDVGV